MLWKINRERKCLVLTDHDPNSKKYVNKSLKDLEQKLNDLDDEEDELIETILKNYGKAKNIIQQRLENEFSNYDEWPPLPTLNGRPMFY